MEPTAENGTQLLASSEDADQEMADGTEKHTKKKRPILELTDEDDNPVPRPKKSKNRKLSKKKATVIDSDDESSDDQVRTKKRRRTQPSSNLAISGQADTDIEEIPNPKNTKETPEEELGKL